MAMKLQNRVAPDGSLHRYPARGLFTGNRGVIHDPETRRLTGRRWTTKSWIVCTCDWKGRRRDVWGRNGPNSSAGWTELFFLDEVTALAAGHRPCFFCRRPAARAFAQAFAWGNRMDRASAPEMDAILHGQRLLSSRRPPPNLTDKALAALPDGAMVQTGSDFHALRGGKLLRWQFGGYDATVGAADIRDEPIALVTPPATVAALAAGYDVQWADRPR